MVMRGRGEGFGERRGSGWMGRVRREMKRERKEEEVRMYKRR